MGKIKVIELTKKQCEALENGYRHGTTHSFRQRCQMVLLKSEKRTSSEVVAILGGCEMTVNNWLNRYVAEGIKGLQTKPGRGRKAILQATDLEQVKEAVKRSRQKISVARVELEETLGKEFSNSSLKRYLKKTLAATNELENA
ncbi:MAG: helix-turn-helix domain-containing protein [Acidobacteriota bacterium]|jgi:transposase|nr:helix-turn-helix domain-containing protein [Acidobacteriota bacterium]